MCVVWFNMVELTAHMVVQFDLNVIRVCDVLTHGHKCNLIVICLCKLFDA